MSIRKFYLAVQTNHLISETFHNADEVQNPNSKLLTQS
jgi:hypothetical protein